MDQKKKLYLQARAEVIKALAHPSRLFIVEELSRGEQCVCRLTEMIGADTSTVSRHLSILKNVGIVQDDKRANQVFYRLHCPCVLDFLGCMDTVIASKVREHLSFQET